MKRPVKVNETSKTDKWLSSVSFTARTDVLCELLEVAIHGILFVRGIYPPGATDCLNIGPC